MRMDFLLSSNFDFVRINAFIQWRRKINSIVEKCFDRFLMPDETHIQSIYINLCNICFIHTSATHHNPYIYNMQVYAVCMADCGQGRTQFFSFATKTIAIPHEKYYFANFLVKNILSRLCLYALSHHDNENSRVGRANKIKLFSLTFSLRSAGPCVSSSFICSSLFFRCLHLNALCHSNGGIRWKHFIWICVLF